MRHRVAGRKLGRTTAHRKAMQQNLAAALFRHGRVRTTVQKAKDTRPFAEKLITLAKERSLQRIRRVISILQDKEMAYKLFGEIAPLFAERHGGYTRIVRLPGGRVGDNAQLALFELVERPASDEATREKASTEGKKS